jgi:hypothetical protein
MRASASFAVWRRAANAKMTSDYAMSLEDAGFDASALRQHWRTSVAADEFVERFATRHDLTKWSEWSRAFMR